MEIKCLYAGGDIVGESPLWDAAAHCLYWADLNQGRVHRINTWGAVLTWQFDATVSAISLTSNPGCLLVATGGSLVLWWPACDRRAFFATVEPAWPAMRLNDGATDPNGNFWIGSMSNNVSEDGSGVNVEWADGALYRVDRAGCVKIFDHNFRVPNTIAWSPSEGTFYCGCSMADTIWTYCYDSRDSSIGNRRTFLHGVGKGLPDGSAIDADGYLWNCRYGGSAILRFAPNGTLDRTVEMPVTNPTHCAFGGPAMTTLYVTSARLNAPEHEKLAGGLFTIQTGIPGLESRRFQLP